MAIKFQYNKTSLQQLEKQLKVRVRTLPIIKNKESALRMEVKRCKSEAADLEERLEKQIQAYEAMFALWNEFDTSLIKVNDVHLGVKKIAGVRVPLLENVDFEIRPYSLFNAPKWYADGIHLLKELAHTAIEREFTLAKLGLLEHARKKTTQKVNLFEKVQIPGYQDALRKIKRFMEDEENLSKSSQKILKSQQEKKEGGRSMITKMKKLTFLVYHKEYEDFLNSLRELGVVHIVEKQQGAAENAELQDNIRLSARLAAALKLLQNQKHEKDAVIAANGGSAERGLQVLDEIDGLQAEHSKLLQQQQTCGKEKDALEAWGNFEPEGIQRLKDAGYVVGFYTCSEGNYKEEWEAEYNAMIICRISSKVFFITVTKDGEEVDLDVEQAKLPSQSLAQLEAQYANTETALEENEKKLVALSETDIPSLKEALKQVQTEIEFSKVVLSTEQTAGDKLMLLEGWAPATSKVEIEAYLNDAHIYYEITDPTPEDNVPIELNNKGFFAWFEPICKLYMLPKYNELDLTPFFAPFFMIFFGLCLGDSGYGLFLFVGATAYRLLAKKLSQSAKSIISLIQILATSTFFCGLLTGTFSEPIFTICPGRSSSA